MRCELVRAETSSACFSLFFITLCKLLKHFQNLLSKSSQRGFTISLTIKRVSASWHGFIFCLIPTTQLPLNRAFVPGCQHLFRLRELAYNLDFIKTINKIIFSKLWLKIFLFITLRVFDKIKNICFWIDVEIRADSQRLQKQ